MDSFYVTVTNIQGPAEIDRVRPPSTVPALAPWWANHTAGQIPRVGAQHANRGFRKKFVT